MMICHQRIQKNQKFPNADLIKNQVIAKGFASNKDFVSDIDELDDSRSFIVNIDNIENERPYELVEIFEVVSSDWIDSLKIESINTQIDKILEGSKSLEEIANFVKKEILFHGVKEIVVKDMHSHAMVDSGWHLLIL